MTNLPVKRSTFSTSHKYENHILDPKIISELTEHVSQYEFRRMPQLENKNIQNVKQCFCLFGIQCHLMRTYYDKVFVLLVCHNLKHSSSSTFLRL